MLNQYYIVKLLKAYIIECFTHISDTALTKEQSRDAYEKAIQEAKQYCADIGIQWNDNFVPDWLQYETR